MKTLVFIILVALGVPASQAGDTATLEQTRKKFEAADALLDKVYKEACAELDKTKAAGLQKKQAAWLAFREARSESIARADAGAEYDSPKLSADYWRAMTGYTEERTDFLLYYSGKNVPAGITGEYTDSFDGDLQLDETKEGINFAFSVVRGSAAHTGQISGIAERKGDKAYFKEKLEAGESGPACELVFTFMEGHIVRVLEKTPDPDAGSGVHYDGDYYKTEQPAKP